MCLYRLQLIPAPGPRRFLEARDRRTPCKGGDRHGQQCILEVGGTLPVHRLPGEHVKVSRVAGLGFDKRDLIAIEPKAWERLRRSNRRRCPQGYTTIGLQRPRPYPNRRPSDCMCRSWGPYPRCTIH